jgi:BirA family biotin operon repressor/biotin-[acetyl-CoA-carboxylase] ligase
MEDSLSPAAITSNLGTRFIGQRVIYYSRLTSTNEVAKQEAQSRAVEGTVVITGKQTTGKGRRKRVWLSPKGNIALSIILYPDIAQLPSLIMLASLAVVRSIKAVTGLVAQIKWPNDVLINGKKVCGILIESNMMGDTVDYAVIGIGVNVNLSPSDFPEISSMATSLSSELGGEVSLSGLIRRLLVEIERLYLALLAGGAIYEEWRDGLVTLGKEIRVASGKTICEGIAESVARDGSLLLRCSDGSLSKIVAGDVITYDRI